MLLSRKVWCININMMDQNVIREITPLNSGDCFILFSRVKKNFDFPLHYHEEYELNLILNGKGVKRIIGDSVEIIGDVELVLIGPNVKHGWFTHECTNETITEVTIQFHPDLFDDSLLKRNHLCFLKSMFDLAQYGISFSDENVQRVVNKIIALSKKPEGFDSVLHLLAILHDLSVMESMRMLSNPTFTMEELNYNSGEIEKVFEYMYRNYDKQLKLPDIANIVNMPESAFRQFFKKCTGKTFSESLNEIRLEHALNMLIDTTYNIAEIGYMCGFINISNFNRIFKRKKMCIPKEFREAYSSNRVFA